MSEIGLYRDQYIEFWKRRSEASGYDFGKASRGNDPPPTLRFPKPLRWWSWDRPQRRHTLRRFRDEQLEEIMKLSTASTPARE